MEHAGGDGSSDGDGDRRAPGRGKGREGWSPLQQHPQEQLRRPHQPNNANQTPGNPDECREKGEAGSYEVRNSNLSANAAVFVPRNLGPTAGTEFWYRPSAQDRIALARNQQPCPPQQMHRPMQQQHHYISHHQQQQQQQYSYQMQQMHYQGQQYADPDAGIQGYLPYEGGYRNYNRPQANGSERSGDNNQVTTFAGVLRQLENAMDTLNRSPGQFDDLVVPLVCSITPHLKNSSHTQEIVNAIIKQSIRESNFRYSGARLCAHLDAVDSPSDDGESIFRTALYTRCREDTESETLRWQEEQNEKTCHGLMLCLAELVAQMDQPAASVLGKLLVQVISVTLKNPGPNSAKLICQSLKLAGQYLERDSSTNREEIERVMRELTQLVTEGRVDVHIGRMVNSVRELRSGNWGRVVSHGPSTVEPSTAVNEQQIPQHLFNEPVLYGPDGTILSAEESNFCQSRATADGVGDDGGDGGFDMRKFDEEDEDDVIAAAYEEFLKLTPNKSGSSVVDRG
ncbi:polyadenylate-binding protein-interacting protein 1 isoform X2 [Venturia canescens]|uniref:polyadenylate-binding protein-interacting protein 1 isoform X2 n=1 Tax=Venturia canescens TaxID=32260 RepID=UPI001C9BE77A|nr:polyadenylate-binding protein-interacting protein 1 isoform X2 [Venturia canescens]